MISIINCLKIINTIRIDCSYVDSGVVRDRINAVSGLKSSSYIIYEIALKSKRERENFPFGKKKVTGSNITSL